MSHFVDPVYTSLLTSGFRLHVSRKHRHISYSANNPIIGSIGRYEIHACLIEDVDYWILTGPKVHVALQQSSSMRYAKLLLLNYTAVLFYLKMSTGDWLLALHVSIAQFKAPERRDSLVSSGRVGRCELDSRRLQTVADRKLEVQT